MKKNLAVISDEISVEEKKEISKKISNLEKLIAEFWLLNPVSLIEKILQSIDIFLR